MEENKYLFPNLLGVKHVLRSTGEEVEIIDSEIKYRGERSDEDWVTYIDSHGYEHIKEKLNVQLDFKPAATDTWNSVLDLAKANKMPSIRNSRIFEVAKELLIHNGTIFEVEDIVKQATKLVDEVGED